MAYNYSYGTPEIEIQGAQRVNGMQAAAAFPVAPLARIVLYDPTNNAIYIRSGHQTGFPPIAVYQSIENAIQESPRQEQLLPPVTNHSQSYQPVQQNYSSTPQVNLNQNNLVTKEEYMRLLNDVSELREEIRRMRNVGTVQQ